MFIPNPPTLKNYVQVFTENSMGLYFWNSLVVSGGATLIALLVGVPAGYGIARLDAQKLTVLILIARMTPALSYLIPLFTVFQFLGLNNTLTALVITHLVITVPIVVYIMVGYFETLPQRARGGGADRRRQRVDAVPLRGAAARAPRHRRRARSSRSSSRGTTSCSAPCWRAARRGRCRPPFTTC